MGLYIHNYKNIADFSADYNGEDYRTPWLSYTAAQVK